MFGRKGLQPGPPAHSAQPPQTDAIARLCQYVCAMSPPGVVRFERYLSSIECASQTGKKGFRYDVKTDQGDGFMFIFPDFASLWLASEAQPRPQIPMSMIENRIGG